MSTWFRVHNDILDNPKLIMIAESDRWRFLGILSLQSQGVLEKYEGEKRDKVIAAKLRLTGSEWQETKRRLQEEELIDEGSMPIGWKTRQYASDSSAERTRKYRERKKKTKRDESVTSQERHSDAEVTPPDTDTDTDKPMESPNGDSCAEPSGSPPAALDTSPRVFSLPTNKHRSQGELFHVTEAMVSEWSELYPAVDVMQHLRNMSGWSAANPTKRKTLGGMPKFINAWLAREQDRGGAHENTKRTDGPGANSRRLSPSQRVGARRHGSQ